MLSQKELRKILNSLTPEQKAKMKVSFILNPNYVKDSKIKIEDRTTAFAKKSGDTSIKSNPLLKKAEPKYLIRIVMPNGRFIQLQGIDTKFFDPQNKDVEIYPIAMTRDQNLQYFYPPKPTTNETLDAAFKDTIESYAMLQLVYEALEEAMKHKLVLMIHK